MAHDDQFGERDGVMGSAASQDAGTPDADRAFQQLQAADPAAAAEIDLTAVRRSVQRQIDRADGGQRPRGPQTWLRVAAAAAAVAVVGGAGFAIGSSTSSVPRQSASSTVSTTGTAAPAIALDGGSPGTQGAMAPGVAPSPSAAGGRLSAETGFAGAASDSFVGGWGARIMFVDGGLSTDAGSGEAWTYDPSQVVSKANAEAIGARLGLSGEAVARYGSWAVGSQDGTGPNLTLSGDAVGSIGWWDPAVANTQVCYPDQPSMEPGVEPSECTLTDTSPPIADDAAIAISRDTIGKLGLDPDSFEFVSESALYGQKGPYGHVSAYAVLNGQRTGQAWSFDFVGDRQSSFYGQLAPLVSVGQYDVVSAAEALQRLNDPRFGTTGAVYPVDYVWPDQSYPAGPDSSGSEPTDVTVPPMAEPGAAISWPVTTETITSAQLGVAIQYQANGSALLVPAYSLSNDEGVSWSVIAVADSQLDFDN